MAKGAGTGRPDSHGLPKPAFVRGGREDEKSTHVLDAVEYRQLTGDHESTDDRIKERVEFLESFCRSIIQIELKKYVESIPKNTSQKPKRQAARQPI